MCFAAIDARRRTSSNKYTNNSKQYHQKETKHNKTKWRPLAGGNVTPFVDKTAGQILDADLLVLTRKMLFLTRKYLLKSRFTALRRRLCSIVRIPSRSLQQFQEEKTYLRRKLRNSMHILCPSRYFEMYVFSCNLNKKYYFIVFKLDAF